MLPTVIVCDKEAKEIFSPVPVADEVAVPNEVAPEKELVELYHNCKPLATMSAARYVPLKGIVALVRVASTVPTANVKVDKI